MGSMGAGMAGRGGDTGFRAKGVHPGNAARFQCKHGGTHPAFVSRHVYFNARFTGGG